MPDALVRIPTMTDLKLNTLSLLYISRLTRKHYPRVGCHWTRVEIAESMRRYLRANDHRLVRSCYQRGDALYGTI